MLPRTPDEDKAIANPVLAEAWRGEGVESIHRGAVCVIDSRGGTVYALGDVDRPIYPRSALKPFQALGVVESGAAAHFRLSDAELALACGSHAGHEAATTVAWAWLEDLDLPESALICGAHEPLDLKAAAQLIRDDAPPRRVHHNCSGKHLGMLTTCLHLGADISGYARADHPVQTGWMAAFEEMAEESLTDGPRGLDGCGLPAISLSLRGLARAAAVFAGRKRGEGPQRLRAAMAARADLVAGPGRFDTECLGRIPGAVLVKSGAEGVRIGMLTRRGLGFAIKIDDGAARACDAASAALIARLLGPADPRAAQFAADGRRPILNAAGELVGAVRPADLFERTAP